MATSKQRKAARANIKKATAGARRKGTLSKPGTKARRKAA
jgi:hypothetical protein